MQYLLIAAPLLAIAIAQSTSGTSSSSSSSSSIPYTNPATSFLTQTNSLGVVTGQPTPDLSQPSLPAGVTTQPEVATIPAGLGEGLHTIYLNISSSLTSFVASVGSSTTVVVGNGAATVTTGSSAGIQSGTSTSGSHNSGSSSSSGAGPTSTGAASSNFVSGGLVGLGAFVAALL